MDADERRFSGYDKIPRKRISVKFFRILSAFICGNLRPDKNRKLVIEIR
jgi:hypothetical protein